jgi:tetratricopeptide (TPR) repeat protein
LLVCVALEWFKTWTYASPSPFLSSLFPSRTASLKYQESGGLTASTTRMLDWIRTGTDRKGNILAKYSLSPSILLYTGRSVVLTPAVFERISSTSKFNSIYTNLYSSENDFYTACRKYGIGYYVYSVDEFLDNSVYSTRYLVNRTNFDTQSAAGLFQFQPQALEHFTLIWQNEYFRIFRITDKRTSPTTETSYYPCYDPDVFGSMGIGHPEFLQKWNRAFSLKTVADQLLMRGQSEQAEQYYNASLEAFPQYPDVLANLGRIYLRRKQIDRAAQTFEKSLSIAYSPEAAYGLTIVSFFRQQNASREQALLSILGRPPFYLPAVFDLVDLYMRRNDIDRAIRLCQKASADHPDRRELYDLLIRIARQTGRPEIERQALMALHKIQSLPSAAAP